jgi:two-component system sensor histidine kinase YesM
LKIINFIRSSLKLRILVTLIIFVFIPFFVVNIILYHYLENKIEEKSIESADNVALQISNQVGGAVGEVCVASNVISQDTDVISALTREETDNNTKVEDRIVINDFCENVQRNTLSINSDIILMDMRNNIYSTLLINQNQTQQLFQSGWYKDIINKKGYYDWFESTYSSLGVVSGENSYLIAMGRSFNDYSGRPCGVVINAVKQQDVEKMIDKMNVYKNAGYFITDNQGEKLLSSHLGFSDTQIRKLSQDEKDSSSGNLKETVNGKSYLVFYNNQNLLGWKVYLVVPQSIIYANIDKIRDTSLIIYLIVTTCFIFGVYFTMGRFLKPVKSLSKLMGVVKGGNLFVRFQSKTIDEISLLGQSFNEMLSNLSRLMRDNLQKQQEIYDKEKEKEKLSMLVLQSQINPHFLFNTLNNIKWLATINNDEQVATRITALGNLLEASIRNFDNEYTVEEEIICLKSYIAIMELTYAGKFTVEFQISEAVMKDRVPKLILQPAVENSIIHGALGGAKQEILVRGFEKEGDIYFEVIDDGAGIDKETLSRLNRNSRPIDRYHLNKLGILNTQRRIQLQYGEQYGLTVESELRKGTKVTIHLPAVKQIEKSQD